MRLHRFRCLLCCIVPFLLQGCAIQKPPVTELPPVAATPSASSQPATPVAPPAFDLQQAEKSRQFAAIRSVIGADREYREQRRRVYEDESARWQALEEKMAGLQLGAERPTGWYQCLVQLQDTASAYARLRDQLEAAEAFEAQEMGALRFGEAYQSDIAYLEGNCDQIYQVAEAAVSTRQNTFFASAAEQMAQAVVQYADDGLNAEAIAVYRNLVKNYPGRAVAPETTMKYSVALFRGGRMDEAIQALRDSLKSIEVAQPVGRLQRLLADLLLVAGRSEEARKEYEKLSSGYASQRDDRRWVEEQLALLRSTTLTLREQEFFASVLKDFMLFDGKRVPASLKENVLRLERQYPGSVLANRARQIQWQAEQRVGGWVGKELIAIDGLIERKDFAVAVARLEGLLKEELTDEVRRVVQQTLDTAVVAKQEEVRSQEMLVREALINQWDEGNRLFDLRQYDGAIAAFAGVVDGEYRERAQARMREAALLATADLRREAAGLFVKARKTNDSPQKKEYAVASWRLLRQILVKYPDTDVVPKVRDNLKSLEEYLHQLDPALLPGLRAAEAGSPAVSGNTPAQITNPPPAAP